MTKINKMAINGDFQSVFENGVNVTSQEDYLKSNCDFKDSYYSELKKFYDLQVGTIKKPWTNEKIIEVIGHIKNAQASIESGSRRTPSHYYWSKKYDVISIGDVDYLMLKKETPDSPTARIVPVEEYYDILFDIHRGCEHGGRDKMSYQVSKDRIIVPKKAIELFVLLCPVCESKRNTTKKGSVVKPITSTNVCQDFNERGQVDVIVQSALNVSESKSLQNLRNKKWKYETAMAFLLPHCEEQSTSTPVVKSESENSQDGYDEDSLSPVENLSTFENDSQESLTTEGSSRSPYGSPQPLFPNIPKPAKRRKREENVSELLMKYLLQNEEKQDDIDKFFIAVSATVKKLSPYNQAILKSKIFNLVSEVEISELNVQNNQKYLMAPEGSSNPNPKPDNL